MTGPTYVARLDLGNALEFLLFSRFRWFSPVGVRSISMSVFMRCRDHVRDYGIDSVTGPT